MKAFVALISLGIAATTAIADNASCPSCLPSRPIAAFAPLMSPAISSLQSNLGQLRFAETNSAEDNVAPLLNPKLIPSPPENNYLNIVPNHLAPKPIVLPGSEILSGLNPRFESPYWNWRAPSFTQWMAPIYSSPVDYPLGNWSLPL
jgi:hypothetical protein